MKKLVVRFTGNEAGATAIEYGLIAAGIAIAIVVAVDAVGAGLTPIFQSVADNLGGGGAAPAPVP